MNSFRRSVVLFYNIYFKRKIYTISSKSMPFKYPSARRDDEVVDDYHGVKIHDPYRWLEDTDSDETKSFVTSQNDVTVPYLNGCPVREKITQRLTKLWNFPKYSCPFKEGKYYYYFMNTGLQNQSVLYKQDSLDGEATAFLDPNELSKEGLTSISFMEFSEDGKYMAYGLSESGSDWTKIKIREVETGEDLPDVLLKVKFSEASWTHDNKGFFYSRYPDSEGTSDGTEKTVLENQKVYYHRIGTSQSEDVLCVEFTGYPKYISTASVSNCGHYVIISVVETCIDEKLYVCDLRDLPDGITGKLPLKCIVGKFEADYSYINNEGSNFLFKTNKDAPSYRLVNIDFDNHDPVNWVDLIPEESSKVIDWAVCVNEDKLLVCYMEDVKSVLWLHDMKTGEKIRNIPLDVGSITGFSGKKKLSEVFFRFVSFLSPGIIYHMDLKDSSGAIKEFRRINVPDFDPSKFQTTQVFYSSKDGTKVPMFIVHKKDLVRDGSAKTLLYCYGGFNISLKPQFSTSRIIFIDNFNGVLAIPNVRGGGEYGRSWHDAGRILKRQNVYDDVIAAAEYLVEHKYTSPKNIVTEGGSNGGLVVSACMNQRPDLFGCVIAHVGVMDMLRFHKFTIGSHWTSDFGSSDTEEEFHCLLKYSPLHNIRVPAKPEVQYPAVLLTTGDHDDRVVPLHSLKLIAEMQHRLCSQPKQTNPIMIRLDVKAGHGAGKPTTKVIEELSDVYSFICLTIGLNYQD